MSFPSRSAETKQATISLTGVIELKGKVECEPPVLAENQTATKCRFKSESGEIYTLVSNRLSEALFADTNLHGKKLVVHGRVDAKARTLEIAGNLRSLRDGKLNELFYYCDICSINGIEPGPCMCCREAVRLVEEPVPETEKIADKEPKRR